MATLQTVLVQISTACNVACTIIHDFVEVRDLYSLAQNSRRFYFLLAFRREIHLHISK